jgi:hypothetical protein
MLPDTEEQLQNRGKITPLLTTHLVPVFVERLRYAEQDLQAQKIAYMIGSLWRTDAYQIALYAQGRESYARVCELRKAAGLAPISEEDAAGIVTWCDGVTTKSAHQEGCAVDIIVMVKGKPTWWYAKYDAQYRAIARVMRAHGFVCGIDWPKERRDPPHYEVRFVA